jgi:tripartite ATP-independent transporter DctM subunit
MVMVISCMFFGAISGSGVADVTAIGSLMLPAMDQQGYKKGLSCSLLGCAGSLGTVIPPSIVMIILGVTTGTSIGKLYLGGFIPGVFTGLCLMGLAWVYATRMHLPPGNPFSMRKVVTSFRQAFLSLLTPVIIIGGIVSGVFTATEAAAAGSPRSSSASPRRRASSFSSSRLRPSLAGSWPPSRSPRRWPSSSSPSPRTTTPCCS